MFDSAVTKEIEAQTGTLAPSVAIETHGCKLNQADSGRMVREFLGAGFRLVAADEPADVYVLNSCTVTHVADRKARHAIRAARRRNPEAVVVATGCYPQRAPGELQGMSEVDLVIGNVGKDELVSRIVDRIGAPPSPFSTGAEPIDFRPEPIRNRSMVKIQEGCNQVCAYCIVPRVRGRERSVPPEEIVAEINRHAEMGYREVVLTGTQLGSYGFDLPDITLTGLLRQVVAETELPRLRISSLQPQEIGSEMLDLWSDHRLCPHFHMPLQSGSDKVLAQMRRRYTSEMYAAAVEMVRNAVADVSITTDVIVGFPGETDEDFEKTYRLCEETGFAAMHVFPYSVRPGTSAAHYGGRVADDVKTGRMRRLLALASAQAAEFRAQYLGRVRSVLWEGRRENNGSGHWSGLTDNYIRVVAPSDRRLRDRITPARLVRQKEGLVYAQVLL